MNDLFQIEGMSCHIVYGELGITIRPTQILYDAKTKNVLVEIILKDIEFEHLKQKIIPPEVKEKIILSQEMVKTIQEKVEKLKNDVIENKMVD